MRALFFGTPPIAVPALEALVELADVAGVVCQPDKPAGRGLTLKAPAVKQRALELGLTVMQPEKIRTPEFTAWVRSTQADFALVMAYGRILPASVLAAPRRGCLNLHASLLPRYRGAAPINWAIVRGETETGISLMQMDEGCDTGPVYSRHALPIDSGMTADDLGRELAELAARVVASELERAVMGELEATPQVHGEATLAPLLKKEDGRVPWQRSARVVHDHVRGMTSWPGAWTTVGGKTMKLLKARIGKRSVAMDAPGTVLFAAKDGIEVACGEGTLVVLRAQMEGRKPLDAHELVAGRTLREGLLLGDG